MNSNKTPISLIHLTIKFSTNFKSFFEPNIAFGCLYYFG